MTDTFDEEAARAQQELDKAADELEQIKNHLVKKEDD